MVLQPNVTGVPTTIPLAEANPDFASIAKLAGESGVYLGQKIRLEHEGAEATR